VKGGDYAEQYLPEEEAVQQVGGRLVILPLAGALTTSDFMEHMISCVSSQVVADAYANETHTMM
jgi:D-beta-D-heptose 7-phosphate kinase/D-beta-D-heptose 1-phosphate adenosyltransferase